MLTVPIMWIGLQRGANSYNYTNENAYSTAYNKLNLDRTDDMGLLETGVNEICSMSFAQFGRPYGKIHAIKSPFHSVPTLPEMSKKVLSQLPSGPSKVSD